MVTPSKSPSLNRIHVLIVDDEETQVELVKLNLEKLDPNIDTFSVDRPSKALKLLKSGGYDCVVSDYSFPSMSGIELCREIKKSSTMPFILYTARGSEEVAAEAFTSGAEAYIKKESELAHYIVLAKRIRDVVEKSRIEEELRRTNEDLKHSKEQLEAYVNMLEERVAERTIEIRETKERLESFMDSAPDAILIYDPMFRLLDLNNAALSIYPSGTSKKDLVGKKMSELAPGIENTDRYRGFIRTLENGEEYHEDGHRTVFEFGAGWASTWAFRMGKNLAIIRRDVTQREEERRKQIEEEKLVAITRMSQVVAHDLRGPLGAIVQAINMAKRDPGIQPKMMKIVEENAVKSLTMIADWRSNTRSIVPQFVETDPAALVEKVTGALAKPANIKVTTSVERVDTIKTDPEILRKVLNNLIENAIEAMPDGGTLSISAHVVGKVLAMEIRDTGVGISEEAKNHLFTPLYTTKPGGMGLGLAYAKRAVEILGGNIHFETTVGDGTTFRVELPLMPHQV